MRVDAQAERPPAGHRGGQPGAEPGHDYLPPWFSALCSSCSERTPMSPRMPASMPCTAADTPCTVVTHGMLTSDCRRTDFVAVDARARVPVRGVEHHVDLAGTDRVDGRHRRPVRLRPPRSACEPRRTECRCGAASPRYPRWPAPGSQGRPAASPETPASACPGWPPRRRSSPIPAATRRPRSGFSRTRCRSRGRCPSPRRSTSSPGRAASRAASRRPCGTGGTAARLP